MGIDACVCKKHTWVDVYLRRLYAHGGFSADYIDDTGWTIHDYIGFLASMPNEPEKNL